MSLRRGLGILAAAACVAAASGGHLASVSRVAARVTSAGGTTSPVAAPLGGSTPSAASPDPTGCTGPLDTTTVRDLRRLPSPVLLETSCGHFEVFPSGQVIRAPVVAPVDPGYRVPAGPHAWAAVQNGRVVLVQRGVIVWRSSGAAYHPLNLGTAVLGEGWVAFSVYSPDGDVSRLFVSRGSDPERVVALNEDPVAATTWGGFVASRWRSNGSAPDLVARRADGSFVAVIAARVGVSLGGRDGTILFLSGGRLWRTDGRRTMVLADLSFVGRPRYVGLEPLDRGRILVTGPDHVAVLRRDGGVEASASLAPISNHGWGFIGAHGADPQGNAVIVVATRWRDESMGGGPGWEGVYLLRPGARGARLLFGRSLTIAVCAHSASVSWHGRWVLYAACEGRVVAIDTSGRQAPIVLTRLARSVPEPVEERTYGLTGAEWASSAPPVVSSLR